MLSLVVGIMLTAIILSNGINLLREFTKEINSAMEANIEFYPGQGKLPKEIFMLIKCSTCCNKIFFLRL